MKKLSFSLLLPLLFVPSVVAQTAAPQAREKPPTVGRLFLSPNERRQLEINPDSTTSLDIDWDHIDPNSHGKGGPGILTVNGAVLRKSGKHTVWINGQSSEYRGPYGSRAPEVAMPLSSESGMEIVTIKPGQVMNPRLGTKGDPFMPSPSN